jgi:hypothetical protein
MGENAINRRRYSPNLEHEGVRQIVDAGYPDADVDERLLSG